MTFQHLASPLRTWALALVLASWVWLPALAAEGLGPSIVNGHWTQGEPSTVTLIDPAGRGFCSATLVGCRHVVTATHCVADALPPEVVVFFQHGAQRARVSNIAVHPGWGPPSFTDIAVLELESPVTGIQPTPINDVSEILPGSAVSKTGFGVTGDLSGFGIKRTVRLNTSGGGCSPGLLCYDFLDPQVGGSACHGDSGGPMFAEIDGIERLVGVTSGGTSCVPPGQGFDTDVFFHRTWLAEQIGADHGSGQCGGVAEVGSDDSRVTPFLGYLWPASPVGLHSWMVTGGTDRLRFSLNGGNGLEPLTARIRYGAPPTETEFDCEVTPFDSCEIPAPAGGPWFALILGVGEYQATASELFPIGSGSGGGGLPPASNPTEFCTNSFTRRCVDGTPLDRRFEMQAAFTDPLVGFSQAAYFNVVAGLRGGLAYFFQSSNPEVLAKVLNGCAINGHYWLFASAATTLEYELTVLDRATGTTYSVGNQAGQIAQPVVDTRAFPCD